MAVMLFTSSRPSATRDGRKVLLPEASQPLEFDAIDISMIQDGTRFFPMATTP